MVTWCTCHLCHCQYLELPLNIIKSISNDNMLMQNFANLTLKISGIHVSHTVNTNDNEKS